jgi:hypothetical protein
MALRRWEYMVLDIGVQTFFVGRASTATHWRRASTSSAPMGGKSLG